MAILIILLPFILLIVVLFLLLISYLRKKVLNKRKRTILICIVVIFMLIIPSFIFIYVVSNMGPGCVFDGIIVNYDNSSINGNSLEKDFKLNETMISKMNDTTITLILFENRTKETTTIHYTIVPIGYNDHQIFVKSWVPLFIRDMNSNEKYFLSFHVLIKSLDPDVNRINFIGKNNYLNFTIMGNEKFEFYISMDNGFESFAYVIHDHEKGKQVQVLGTDFSFIVTGPCAD